MAPVAHVCWPHAQKGARVSHRGAGSRVAEAQAGAGAGCTDHGGGRRTRIGDLVQQGQRLARREKSMGDWEGVFVVVGEARLRLGVPESGGPR